METTKGVVILYEDLCDDWIRFARDGRLTSLGVHKLAYQSGAQSVEELLADLDAPGGRRRAGALPAKRGGGACCRLESLSLQRRGTGDRR